MTVEELADFARRIRKETLKALNTRGFGHFGGSMSVVEVLAVLYGDVMRIDPENPHWPARDYLVLSKGHAGPALYSALALKGYFPQDMLATLNENGTLLPGHPDRLKTPGVDVTTGSLGQGVSIAAGLALSHQLALRDNRFFCILGDGELNEGQCWEAVQFIAHHSLCQLTLIVDWNKQQLDGALDDVIRPFDLAEKFAAFGFEVLTIKGDDVAMLQAALKPLATQEPRMILLDSIKGQGVPWLEQLDNSHHLRLDKTQRIAIERAIVQLEEGHV